MSVVIVGGHDRMVCQYKKICKGYKCKAKVFTQMSANLSEQIWHSRSADLVYEYRISQDGTLCSCRSREMQRRHCAMSYKQQECIDRDS